MNIFYVDSKKYIMHRYFQDLIWLSHRKICIPLKVNRKLSSFKQILQSKYILTISKSLFEYKSAKLLGEMALFYGKQRLVQENNKSYVRYTKRPLHWNISKIPPLKYSKPHWKYRNTSPESSMSRKNQKYTYKLYNHNK